MEVGGDRILVPRTDEHYSRHRIRRILFHIDEVRCGFTMIECE